MHLWLPLLLLVNSVYLYVADHLDVPPRTEPASFIYLASVLVHFILGIGIIPAFLFACRALVGAFRETADDRRRWILWIAGMALISLAVCLTTGLILLAIGSLRPQRPVLTAHVVSAAATVALGIIYLRLRVWLHPSPGGLRYWRAARYFGGAALVLPVLFLSVKDMLKTPANTIENPRWAPMSAWEEGDGKGGLFFPSSVQSKHSGFFPSEYFTDSASCGVAGCHPDIYRQWFASSHHFSSFNNQWYRKSIEYMQEVLGPQASKWCGGCHDMAVLLTEMSGTGRSRMDFPIKDQLWPPRDFAEAHAGIACSACHSIVQVKSTMGQGDYVADYPPMHKYAITSNRLFKALHNFLIRRAPEPHKKTFLKPFHTESAARSCSACHKVHLDEPVNSFRWLRGFNEYDGWQLSGVSGYGARSFYYPSDPQTGRPAYKKCIECHMPRVPSTDAGAHRDEQGAWVHSHRFPAANTALPWVNGRVGDRWTGGSEEMLTRTDDDNYREQFEETVKMLTGAAVTVDLFALRRSPAGEGPGDSEQPDVRPGGRAGQPEEATLFGGEGLGSVQAAVVGEVEEEIVAPMETEGVALRRGETVVVEAVVRTRNVGHAFPGGTLDAFDLWLELRAVDDRGRILLWSGALESKDGPVDRWAHFYRSLMLDAHGNPINKRNAYASRVALYAHSIVPGAADTVPYRLLVPKNCGERITITARLNYRKFHWYNTQFAFAGRPAQDREGRWQRGGRDGLGFSDRALETGRSQGAYGRDGRLELIGAGREEGGGLVSPHWDDRQWVFDADASRVSALLKQVPVLPIITMAEDRVELKVVDGEPPMPVPEPNIPVDRVRWNDYGIGLYLQGDFRRALKAFTRVTEIDPQWPEGWVNIGRVRLDEGNLEEAEKALRQALDLYQGRHDDPMTPYLRARTLFFHGRVLKDSARLPEAVQAFEQVIGVFPEDREVRNQLGRVLFVQNRFQEAIEHFEHTLSIDPEDVAAHYNLSLCFKGVGDLGTARRHEKLYLRFKADETQMQIQGAYVRRSPWDNNEAQQVHEHGPPEGGYPAAGIAPVQAEGGHEE